MASSSSPSTACPNSQGEQQLTERAGGEDQLAASLAERQTVVQRSPHGEHQPANLEQLPEGEQQ